MQRLCAVALVVGMGSRARMLDGALDPILMALFLAFFQTLQFSL
jgi:hypothetical protein